MLRRSYASAQSRQNIRCSHTLSRTIALHACVNDDFSLMRTPLMHIHILSNSYTMGCPPVRGDNPRALASGLSYVQMDKFGITISNHLHQQISVDLAHHEILYAKVGKGGISYNWKQNKWTHRS